MIDLGDPGNPMFAGCHVVSPNTHDAQCVVYQGPDMDFVGREICFNSNESHIGIADVNPVRVSPAVPYPQLGFVHQAWLTEDHRFLFVGDELDELNFGVPTRAHVFDVSDLTSPQYLYACEATTSSIDHNLYVRGSRVYQANYSPACGCWNSATWPTRKSSDAVAPLIDDDTEVIAAEGGLVVPGLIDSHVHFLGGAARLLRYS